MTTVYFAHAMVDYDTAREALAVLAIGQYLVHMGRDPEVVNPNSQDHQAAYDALKNSGHEEPFEYWLKLARGQDYLAFMCMPGTDELIGSGVASEVEAALEARKTVWEVGRQDLRLRWLDWADEAAVAAFRGRCMGLRDTRLVTHMMLEWRKNR